VKEEKDDTYINKKWRREAERKLTQEIINSLFNVSTV
jgi:hypothetical protein